jgi:pimeloyl-ACP methyl ester carboxylesterase
VVEPFQTTFDVEGCWRNSRPGPEEPGPPAILIGHSWGAWLGFLFAAKHPTLVQKLILVSSGPFDESYVPMITKTGWNDWDRKAGSSRGTVEGRLERRPDEEGGGTRRSRRRLRPAPPDAEEKTPRTRPNTKACGDKRPRCDNQGLVGRGPVHPLPRRGDPRRLGPASRRGRTRTAREGLERLQDGVIGEMRPRAVARKTSARGVLQGLASEI